MNPDGSTDLTFQASFGETSVSGIIPLPNGQIVIAGGFSTLNGHDSTTNPENQRFVSGAVRCADLNVQRSTFK